MQLQINFYCLGKIKWGTILWKISLSFTSGDITITIFVEIDAVSIFMDYRWIFFNIYNALCITVPEDLKTFHGKLQYYRNIVKGQLMQVVSRTGQGLREKVWRLGQRGTCGEAGKGTLLVVSALLIPYSLFLPWSTLCPLGLVLARPTAALDAYSQAREEMFPYLEKTSVTTYAQCNTLSDGVAALGVVLDMIGILNTLKHKHCWESTVW